MTHNLILSKCLGAFRSAEISLPISFMLKNVVNSNCKKYFVLIVLSLITNLKYNFSLSINHFIINNFPLWMKNLFVLWSPTVSDFISFCFVFLSIIYRVIEWWNFLQHSEFVAKYFIIYFGRMIFFSCFTLFRRNHSILTAKCYTPCIPHNVSERWRKVSPVFHYKFHSNIMNAFRKYWLNVNWK